jgi:hypothetical protein
MHLHDEDLKARYRSLSDKEQWWVGYFLARKTYHDIWMGIPQRQEFDVDDLPEALASSWQDMAEAARPLMGEGLFGSPAKEFALKFFEGVTSYTEFVDRMHRAEKLFNIVA